VITDGYDGVDVALVVDVVETGRGESAEKRNNWKSIGKKMLK